MVLSTSSVLTLSSLPLLPLGTVLFPGGLLPLRIFEVRYLDMVGKCLKAGAPFGVVSLVRGSEVRQPGVIEEFAEIGTLATINDARDDQPGLMSILCTGTQRFRIQRSEQLKHGLWIADVQHIPDDAHIPVPIDLQGVADALAKLLETLEERGSQADHSYPTQKMQLDDCGWVANRWCEVLPLPLTMKQQLMMLDNPLLRLELVGDFLARNQIAQ